MERKLRFMFLCLPLFALIVGCPTPGGGKSTPPSGPSSGVTIYAGGYYTNSSGVGVPGYWKNGNWVDLPSLGGYEAAVTSLVISGTDVYAAGWCWTGNDSTTQTPGYWLGGLWSVLGGPGSYGAVTDSIALPPGDVFVGGYYFTKNSYGLVQVPGYWSKSGWVGLPTQSIYGATVNAILSAGGHTYAGGWSTKVISTGPTVFVAYPGYWLDGGWAPLPDAGYGGSVNSLAVAADGTIYAGGYEDMGYDPQNPQTALSEACYWSGGSWVGLTSAIAGGPRVTAIAVSANGVFACGNNGSTTGYWSNGAWTPLSGNVTSIAVSGNDVYVGGSNTSGSPGYWKNGAWNGLTPPSGAKGAWVSSLVVQ